MLKVSGLGTDPIGLITPFGMANHPSLSTPYLRVIGYGFLDKSRSTYVYWLLQRQAQLARVLYEEQSRTASMAPGLVQPPERDSPPGVVVEAATAAKQKPALPLSAEHKLVLNTFRLLIADLCQQFNGGHPG